MNKTEESFHTFLTQKANDYGFAEPKKSNWIEYMQDTSHREELARSILSDSQMTVEPGSRALDVGCGFGGLIMALQKHFDRVCGVEIEPERVEWAQKRAEQAEVKCCSATTLPWSDEYFDLVVSTDVFEHVSERDQELVASELMRVLKPGGCGFISVPNKLQIYDEHNYIWFGTWLPNFLRQGYVKLISNNKSYVRCWERTGWGWKHLFADRGFEVKIEPMKIRSFLPASRYFIYLRKT